MDGYRYYEDELEEKLKTMIKAYKTARINLTLVCYKEVTPDSEYLRFFLAENIMLKQYTTFTLNWLSGFMQETINLLPANYLCHDYDRAEIAVVKEWMQKEYGPEVRLTLRGWCVKDDKKEVLKCSLTKEEISEEAYNRVHDATIKKIKEILNDYESKRS